MKINRCKQMLEEGKIPIGHMILEFYTRATPRILEVAGLDFVVIDMEHTGLSATNIADLIAWFKATNITPFVRIPEFQYHFVSRNLDNGAMGIMLPNVETIEQATALINAAKYAPQGNRGVGLGTANTDFRKVNARHFMDYANENTTMICQIESQQGVDNIEEIAALPGVDILWIGHFDLTQSLGIIGDFHHPKFLDALKKVIDAGKKHGKGIAIQPTYMDQAEEWLKMGFNVLSYSGDSFVYTQAMCESVDRLRDITRSQTHV
jgi:2-keto-3-deoxy-L-rhamnonate aldolase RhmA